MRKNCCLLGYCKRGLLGKKSSDLTKYQRDHVQRYHRGDTIHSLGLHGAIFLFRRDPSRYNQFVCVCDALFSTAGSLTVHVMGSRRQSNPQDPCPDITAKARHIAESKEILNDKTKPIDYRPAGLSLLVPKGDVHQHLTNNDDDLHNNEDGNTDLNNNENDNANLNNNKVNEVNIQSILDAQYQTLAEAIKSLKRAQEVIKRLQQK